MAQLYSNENFPIPVVRELRNLGHDVVTIQERGRANEATSDPDVLALARSEGRAILTLNRKDFYRLHEQQPNHAGIIICKVDQDFVRQAQAIHEAIQASGDLAGRVVRVDSSQ
jgi:predicted nuclease of predicted toxin-antitoxin system